LNGFPASRIQVIPNGIDTEVFTINDVKREQFRSSLGFDHDLPIIGMLARFDPIKGHSEFTKVVRELTIDSQKRFGVVLVGGGDAVLAAKACRELEELLPPDLVRVLPDTPQPERVLNGLDVLLVCSQSEGFPNVAAEAMACGCEVAGFAVGDLAQIVLGPELLSLNSSTKDLAGIVSRLLAIGRSRSRKVELREKIVSNFSIQRMGSATENCLARLTGEHQ
jgi:glycosyltransferase involved in cell wall biosynthesis